MSDWRGESKESQPPKKPTNMPVVPRPAQSVPPPPAPKKGDWRNKSLSKGPPKKRTKHAPADIGTLRKSVLLSGISLGTLIALGLFIAIIVFRPRLIPIVVAVANHSSSSPLGEVPYASSQLEFLQNANLKNTTLVFPAEGEPLDRLLQSMDRQEHWLEGFIGVHANAKLRNLITSDNKIQGGGPGKNIVVFYIQGTIFRLANAAGTDAQEWAIAFSDEDGYPFSTSKRSVPVKSLFSQLAKSLSHGSVGLLALDVQTPTLVANLADMEFPTSALEEAFHSLGAEGENLVVMLPCEQGQENWFAPELSTTVFSHYLINGLDSGFGDKKLHLASFESKFKESVRTWVEQNRNGVQIPKFLKSSAIDSKLSQIPLYRSLLTVLPQNTQVPLFSVDTLRERYRALDRLWEGFAEIQPFAFWDPILYSQIEAQLIALEDIAEQDGQSWNQRIDEVGRNLDKARDRWKCNHDHVSLIEAEFNQRLKRSNLFSEPIFTERTPPQDLASLMAQGTAPLNGSEGDGGIAAGGVASGVPDGGIDPTIRRNDRALRLWRCVAQAASRDDAELWRRVLSPPRLLEALNWLGPTTGGEPEWFEIQQCRILAEETIWRNETELAKAEEGLAHLLRALDKHQRIQTTSVSKESWVPYERTAWSRKSGIDLERRYLAAFDRFVANELDASLQESKKLWSELETAHRKATELEAGMVLRYRIPQVIPHWMAVLMRHYRYSADDESIQKESMTLVEQLADLHHRATILEQQLSKPGEEHPLLDLKLVAEFEDAERHLKRLIPSLGADPSLQAAADPETILSRRAAVRFPYLSTSLRSKYHEEYVQYISMAREAKGELTLTLKSNSGNSSERKSIRLASELTDRFLQTLRNKNSLRQPVYAQYMTSDPRALPWPSFPKQETNRDSLYEQGADARHYAAAIGLLGSLGEQAPWNSVLKFQALCDQEYRELQQQRLYLARWGNGPVRSNGVPFYFQSLASEYSKVNRTFLAAMAESVPTSLNESRHAADAVSSIEALRSTRVQGQSTTKVRIALEQSPEVARWNGAVLAFRQAGLGERRGEVVGMESISSQPGMVDLPFDFEEGALKVRLAVRGHHIDQEVVQESKREGVATRFEHIPGSPIVKVIPDGQVGSLIIALDCSGSMTYGESVTAFENAQRTVQNLLDLLKDLHRDSEIKNDVAIMFFGLDPFPVESDLLLPRQDVRVAGKEVENVHLTRFLRTGSDNYDQLSELLLDPRLKAKGTTPLYNALYFASQVLGARTQNGIDGRRIVVISDGANEVDETKIRGFNCNASELKRALAETNCEVQVFQYNNLQFYRTATDKRDPKNEQRIWPDGPILQDKLKEIAQANSELLGLLQSLSPEQDQKDVFYDHFSLLQKKLTDSFKLPPLTVSFNDSPGTPIELTFSQPKTLPRTGKVRVSVGPPEMRESNPFKEFDLTEDEVVVLKYDAIRSQLFFSPSAVNVARSLPLADGTKPRTDALVDWTQTASQGWVFRVTLRRTKTMEENEYIPRPRFVVASISEANSLLNRKRLLLTDSQYEPSYPPVIVFPEVPFQFPANERVRFELWTGDSLPTKHSEELQVRDGARIPPGRFNATIERQGQRIEVRVKTDPRNRLFVYAPDAVRGVRTFYPPADAGVKTDYDELHELEVLQESASLFLIDEKGLQGAEGEKAIEYRRLEY